MDLASELWFSDIPKGPLRAILIIKSHSLRKFILLLFVFSDFSKVAVFKFQKMAKTTEGSCVRESWRKKSNLDESTVTTKKGTKIAYEDTISTEAGRLSAT